MKIKILFGLLLVVVLQPKEASAQAEKGDFLLGAGANFTQDSYSNEPGPTDIEVIQRQGSAMLPIGYFVANNLATGLTLGFESSYLKNEIRNTLLENKRRTLVANLFVRKYFGEKKLRPFISATGGMGKGIEKIEIEQVSNEKTNILFTSRNFGGDLGVALFLNETVSLEIGIAVANSDILISKRKTVGETMGQEPQTFESENKDFDAVNTLVAVFSISIFL